jgi:ATP-dependent DNA ligase
VNVHNGPGEGRGRISRQSDLNPAVGTDKVIPNPKYAQQLLRSKAPTHQRERPARGVPSAAESHFGLSFMPPENPVKNLAQLKAECSTLDLTIPEDRGRESKEPYLAALRDFHWRTDHPGEPLPPQIAPMLLDHWDDLDPEQAKLIENDGPGWIVSPKLDGVRAILDLEGGRVRLTSRCVSEVTYRLGEFQDNLTHLTTGFSGLDGTILDGELVFPGSSLDTGRTIARHPLQAATSILSTSPEQALRLQARPEDRLRFHAFDILKSNGTDVTSRPLRDRLDFLIQAIASADNPHLEFVPFYTIGRIAIHRRILNEGGEGTVWKQLDQPYEPGRRVSHWIKRKRETSIEAFVTGFKPGISGHGNEDLVGALEFSTRHTDESVRPIAWVSAWSNSERRAMTLPDRNTSPRLKPAYLGRRALIVGQDEAARSGRLRHARLRHWLD